jgi:membrane protein
VATETAPAQPLTEAIGAKPHGAVAPPRDHGAFVTFFIKLFRATLNDQIDNIGAMMAYYAVLALFPMLVFVATVALLVLPTSVIDQGLGMAMDAVPASARTLVFERVQSLVHNANTGFAIVSMIIALWGASRGAIAMMLALNSLYQKKETRPWWKRQLIAIAMTLGVAVLVIAALGLLVAGPIAGHWLTDRFGLGDDFDLVWSIARWVGAGVLVMVLWAMVYRFLPNTKAPFRIFTPGAAIGVMLWLGISYAFGLYLSHFGSYEATYGALGGAVIFLTWLWLSNIAILFGAEINDVLADLRRDRSPAARQLADERERT